MKTRIQSFAISLAFICLGLLQKTQAVSSPPDGGYSGGNTAEGQLALGSLTSGIYNSAVGIYSLMSLTTGSSHCDGERAGSADSKSKRTA